MKSAPSADRGRKVTYGHRAAPSAADRGIDPCRARRTEIVGWFGGPGIDAIGQFFVVLGFSARRRHALMAGLAETGGGLFLALGFLTPAVLFSVMLVAALSVHVKNGFFITNGGYEYTLVLGVAASTFAFTGPGSLSVDALAGYSVSGALCGVAALIVGVLGGVIPLIQRRSADAVNPAAE